MTHHQHREIPVTDSQECQPRHPFAPTIGITRLSTQKYHIGFTQTIQSETNGKQVFCWLMKRLNQNAKPLNVHC